MIVVVFESQIRHPKICANFFFSLEECYFYNAQNLGHDSIISLLKLLHAKGREACLHSSSCNLLTNLFCSFRAVIKNDILPVFEPKNILKKQLITDSFEWLSMLV